MKKQHTYIIPYYEDGNKIFILLAKKKFYSHKDGFIHSNANQLVLIGGHLDKKNKYDIVANIEKEFLEETGYKINKKKISLLQNNNKLYFVGVYKCNNNEYNNFSEFNNLNKDNKYIELNDLIWVELSLAKTIMKTHNSNLNLNYMVNEYVSNFIINVEKYNKWYSFNELKNIYKKYKNENISKKEIAKKIIFPKIVKRDKYMIDKIYKEVKKYITKNSYYDWFIESIELFQNHMKIKNKNIVKLNTNQKKLNTKQKRVTYIPPHLRNK